MIWNHLKLAQIARKHQLPSLAHQHLEKAKTFLDLRPDSKVLATEKFKLHYEKSRFELQFRQNYDLTKLRQEPPFSLPEHAKRLKDLA